MTNRDQASVPVAAVELATDLFARKYGMSGPEIHRAFAPHTDALGTYPMPDGPSRWKIFQRGLEPLDDTGKRLVLEELLDREWPSLEPADLDKLRQLLASGT